MDDQVLSTAIARVPAGSWAVGVSGGADSVALLLLLTQRSDLQLHVVHLNHQTRGQESDDDAKFVQQLSTRLQLPATVTALDQIELANPPNNRSARFRLARLTLFRQVVHTQKLRGVILAHHADDQAETVLLRLLRGSFVNGLAAMVEVSKYNGFLIHRPLLDVRSADLRTYLLRCRQTWREDSSNPSPKYLRNRLRPMLHGDDRLTTSLIKLAQASRRWKNWLSQNSPQLNDRMDIKHLHDLPRPLAMQATRQWLQKQGCDRQQITPAVCQQLMAMANDAATSPRQHFPGKILVCRRGGQIFVQ